jgi:hypothetical protein
LIRQCNSAICGAMREDRIMLARFCINLALISGVVTVITRLI